MASNGVSRHVPNSGLHNNSVYIVLSLGLTCASDKLINITCFLPLQKKKDQLSIYKCLGIFKSLIQMLLLDL